MRIFKSKWFQRFARKEGFADTVLVEAVERVERGQVDAELGGEVVKQRIARPGQGKSKGYRVIYSFPPRVKSVFHVRFFKKRAGKFD